MGRYFSLGVGFFALARRRVEDLLADADLVFFGGRLRVEELGFFVPAVAEKAFDSCFETVIS